PEPYLPEPETIEELKTATPAVAEARRLALSLSAAPTGHFPTKFPADSFSLLNPHLKQATSVLALLEFDAALALTADRDPPRPVRGPHAALNVARAIGDEPTLSAQFARTSGRGRAARIIVQALAWSAPTEGLAELQAALLAEAREPVLLYAMRGHRA